MQRWDELSTEDETKQKFEKQTLALETQDSFGLKTSYGEISPIDISYIGISHIEISYIGISYAGINYHCIIFY